MKKIIYLLNPRSKMLHIKDSGCPNANGVDFIEYKNQDKATKEVGRSIRFCKRCFKEGRNDWIKEEV